MAFHRKGTQKHMKKLTEQKLQFMYVCVCAHTRRSMNWI